MSNLLKWGLLKAGQVQYTTLGWSDGGKVAAITANTDAEKSLRLVYTFTSNRTGEKTDYDYKVYIVAIPSNLERGMCYTLSALKLANFAVNCTKHMVVLSGDAGTATNTEFITPYWKVTMSFFK